MQLVNRIINDAYIRNASDIHIEPNVTKKNVEVRYRIDGNLATFQTVPFSYRSALVSRIKIMSNLDITERRIPQDGKIKFRRSKGDEIELRVATVPTSGGSRRRGYAYPGQRRRGYAAGGHETVPPQL